MKRGFSASFFVLLVAFFFFISCMTPPEPMEKAPEAEPAPVVETQPLEEPADIEPVPESIVETAEARDVLEIVEGTEESFTVSEKVFTETFEDVRRLIDDLNTIIREENYDRWLKYLADGYVEHFSSKAVLSENSNQPLLKKYNITLSSLQDYFRWVVVPSRSNARLDDLVFIDNEHIKAIMIFNNQRTILYLLEKDGKGWKIGL